MKTLSSGPKRLTWRKGKRYSGMMRLAATYCLCCGDEELAIIQENGDQWFWYGGDRNTCATPTDLATAKKEAKAYILSIQS